MPKPRQAAAALAVLLLAAQPCVAAEDLRDSSAAQRRTAPFAGLGLSLPLGGPAKAVPSPRLQFSAARPAGGTFARPGAAPTLQLGLAGAGKPALYMNGRDTAGLGRRLNLGGSKGTVLIVVGGLVLLVLLAAAVADAQPTAGPDEGAFDRIGSGGRGKLFPGASPGDAGVEDRPDHPWLIGVQFHPELKSKPFDPHPLFASFIEAAV